MRTFLNRSDVVVAISQTTQNAIRELFPEYSNKVYMIYPGVDHLLNERTAQNPHPDVEPPYIIAVNSFEKRKNIPFIIKVYSHLMKNYETNHRLLIIGHPSNGFKQVLKAKAQSEFSDDIHVLMSLSTESLNYFYQNSRIFINASSYEGFGFTPLEAINYDLPAFLYKNQVVDEIFGDHPYILADWDLDLWARHIRNELDNDFTNKIHKEEVQQLTWDNSVNKLAELFHQLIYSEEPAFASQ
jgi:glycosyltransferase involved in cell wall biosynthesis